MKVAKGLALFELVLAVALLVVALTTSSWPPAVIGVLLACVGFLFWRDSGNARIAKTRTWELLFEQHSIPDDCGPFKTMGFGEVPAPGTGCSASRVRGNPPRTPWLGSLFHVARAGGAQALGCYW